VVHTTLARIQSTQFSSDRLLLQEVLRGRALQFANTRFTVSEFLTNAEFVTRVGKLACSAPVAPSAVRVDREELSRTRFRAMLYGTTYEAARDAIDNIPVR